MRGHAVPDMPIMTIDGQEYIGYLELPTLDLSLPVMSQWSYPRLRIAPCRYWGNAYDDTLVILAHNYDRHFGRIKNLAIDDPVQFVDAAAMCSTTGSRAGNAGKTGRGKNDRQRIRSDAVYMHAGRPAPGYRAAQPRKNL